MSKHTPGPWRTNGGDDVWIGDARCIYVGDKDDARLIAAAPDLLDVLIDAHNWLSMGTLLPEGLVHTRIKAAIAKATGAL